MIAFLACIYAGVVSVPAAPPTSLRTVERFGRLIEDAKPCAVISSEGAPADDARHWAGRIAKSFPRLSWLRAEGDVAGEQPSWTMPALAPQDIVFLQYTSGSTGNPRGVMVSHGNLVANTGLICTSFALEPSDVGVSWLPPYHDMGLISVLAAVRAGCHSVQLSPLSFLRRPYRWLQAISEYGAKITAAPNFGYELAAQKISEEQKATLDLRSLEFALNGAEHVRAETLQRFQNAFSVCGLRCEALTPVYGLAEATLLVSSYAHAGLRRSYKTLSLCRAGLSARTVRPASKSEDGLTLVSVGALNDAYRLSIVEPETGAVAALGSVGEIWLSGASVARGYWRNPEATAETFGRRIAGVTGAHLRTGDLGFIHEGELYISGRIKELMIFNGRNIYPADVESTVEAIHARFKLGSCAAFSIEDGDVTQLVVVQELESKGDPVLSDVFANVLSEVAEVHEIAEVAAVLLVRAGTLPRTSSGKIQRAMCRDLYLAGQLESILQWKKALPAPEGEAYARGAYEAPEGEIEQALAAIWQDLLGVARVGRQDNFFELGGHSLLAMGMISRIRQKLGAELGLKSLFAQPTLQGLAGEVSQAGASALPAIGAADRSAALALSFAQQRLWFLCQMDGVSQAYHMPAGLRLRGRLDVGALEGALDRIVSRHEVLRTTFAVVEGQPVQRIGRAEQGLSLRVHDLRGHSEADRELQELAREEAQEGFDLQAGPLVRGRLIVLGEEEHVLLVTMHHIVSDGWSMGVLVEELSALYAAFAEGKEDPLAPLSIQYADYAAWQRRWVSGAVLQAQGAYWQRTLAGAPAVLELPTDHPRPSEQTYEGGRVALEFDAGLSDRLVAFSRGNGVTLFMTLLAGWAVVLGRLANQDDVVIGTPTANRTRAEVEGLIGMFLNAFALRIDLFGHLTVQQMLQRVRERALGAQQHQDVPFEQVVDLVKPVRSLAHPPLFQVMFIWQNNKQNALAFPGVSVLPFGLYQEETARLDLTLDLREQDGRIGGSLEYASALFERATVERYAGYLKCVLEEMVGDAQRPLSDLEMLPAGEREQLLSEWNETAAPYPEDKCIHELFEAQVQARAQAVAVVHEDEEVSYGELNARANRLARHLIGLGVRAEARVAICVERSVDMVVGLLAVLKAGGAYVPLDPAYPAERLRYMLEDSAPAVLLTQRAVLERLPQLREAGAAAVVELDGEARAWEALEGQDVAASASGVTPRSLAYVIYTSGSTGQPKGVMVEHTGVVNQAIALHNIYGLGPHDRLSQVSSLSFDGSIEEIFGALLCGAGLVLRTDTWLEGAQEFYEQCRAKSISVVNLPTMFWQKLLKNRKSIPDGIRTMIITGEAVSEDAVEAWFKRQGHLPCLFNAYGPTETTVNATIHEIRDADGNWRTIGRPISNTQIYILDGHGHPVPVGVCGGALHWRVSGLRGAT